MEEVNTTELVAHLNSPDDAQRKKAAFRLQSLIGDLGFVGQLEHEGGLTALRSLALNATGNTLAYSLAAFSRLLDLDKGFEYVDRRLIQRLVELVVSNPLINILRGAVSILAAIVAKPYDALGPSATTLNGDTISETVLGFRALKPVLSDQPTLLEALATRLSSADHALCANSLQLINSLMRDAIINTSNTVDRETHDAEWPAFINRLKDNGVIRAVYRLMQNNNIQDLAHPVYDFQALTKVMLRQWRSIPFNVETRGHRSGLQLVYLGSLTEAERNERIKQRQANQGQSQPQPPPRDMERWRKLGFETENPGKEMEAFGVNFLGLMDLMDFARQDPDPFFFQKLLLEKSLQPRESRCPISKCSLAVTSILYDHFEVAAVAVGSNDSGNLFDQQRYAALESRSNLEAVFKPLLLQWSRLHTSCVLAFIRLWEAAGARAEDFLKIEELVRILVEHVIGLSGRQDDILDIERRLKEYELSELRACQLELLELTHDDTWAVHLRPIKDELENEATQFMREQRIRCLLAGAWCHNHTTNENSHHDEDHDYRQRTSNLTSENASAYARSSSDRHQAPAAPWLYVVLSHNRRQLHYGTFAAQSSTTPLSEALPHKLDLSKVGKIEHSGEDSSTDDTAHINHATRTITLLGSSPTSTPPTSPRKSRHRTHGSSTTEGADTALSASTNPSPTLLTLHMPTSALHSEWLYGLQVLSLSASAATTTGTGSGTHAPYTATQRHPQNHSHTHPRPETTAHHPQRRTSAAASLRRRSRAKQDSTSAAHVTRARNDLNEPDEPHTQALVDALVRYGVKLRMLNVRWEYGGALDVQGQGVKSKDGDDWDDDEFGDDDGDGIGVGGGVSTGFGRQKRETKRRFVVPSREGLEDEFFYDVGGSGTL